MDIDLDQDITRRDDGTLVVTFLPPRAGADDDEEPVGETVALHPGEGGYDDALAAWDLQQDPDRPPAVSTATGREQAMSAVHAAAGDDAGASEARAQVDDPEATAEALRHVLVGGEPSVAAFSSEVAEAHGDDAPMPAHTVAKAIGNVLAELET